MFGSPLKLICKHLKLRPVALSFVVGAFMASIHPASADEINSITKLEWGEAVAGLQISVRAEKNIVSSGNPLVLRVVLKNVGPKTFTYIIKNSELVYGFVVTDEAGNSMPLTRYGQLLHKPADPTMEMNDSIYPVNLLPGEQGLPNRLPLSTMYDISVPETYKIMATMEFSDKGKPIKISSNIVSVKVEGFDGSIPNDPDPDEPKIKK